MQKSPATGCDLDDHDELSARSGQIIQGRPPPLDSHDTTSPLITNYIPSPSPSF